MKHGAEQKIRVLLLYEILQEQTDEQNGLSVRELISKLGKRGISVVRKTLYEDIAVLNEYGYEILCEKVGKSNRYYVVDRKFDRTEVQILLQAVRSARFLTDSKTEKLTEKLLRLLGKTEAEQLQSFASVSADKSHNERIYYSIDAITTAITERKQLSFLYFDTNIHGEHIYRKDKERYIVNPLGIAHNKDNLYLICHSDKYGNAVTYRVDKMDETRAEQAEIKVLPQYKDFDVSEYMQERFEMYGGESENVELLFPSDLVEIAIERFGKDNICLKDDIAVIAVKVQISKTFFAWLATFEGRVKIQSPPNVIEQYKEFLEKILRNISCNV